MQILKKFYLCEELLDALIGRLRPQLDCHLSAVLQEAIVDFPEPSAAEHTLEVVRDHFQFLVREPAVLKLQRALRVRVTWWHMARRRLILRLHRLAH